MQDRWECYYQVDPLEGLSVEGAEYVLGGEACQWGEGINEHNFVSPRLLSRKFGKSGHVSFCFRDRALSY